MKSVRILSENFQFLKVKFSIYLNRRTFVMPFKLTLESYFTNWSRSNFMFEAQLYEIVELCFQYRSNLY